MLEDLNIPQKRVPCKVRTISETMSNQDKDILLNAVMNPEWPMTTLATELLKRDIQLSEQSIRRHRKKACSCWKI